MIWAESTLMVLPHQFSAREASTSRRVTLGRLPSLSLRNEKRPCSPEAKCVVWPFQSAHWSEVAQQAQSPHARHAFFLPSVYGSRALDPETSVFARTTGLVTSISVKEADRLLGRAVPPAAP